MVRTLDDAGLDDLDRKLIQDIEEHGFHIVQVGSLEFPNRESAEPGVLAGWSFTVGLNARFSHSEFAVFGLPPVVAADVLGTLGRQVVNGARYQAGTRLAELIEGTALATRSVRPRWYLPFFGTALWYYDSDRFPILQLHWADREGRLPEEREHPDHPSIAQPLLAEKDPSDARVVPYLQAMEMLAREEEELTDPGSTTQ